MNSYNLTAGTYILKDSFVHRLTAITKLGSLLIAIVALVNTDTLFGYAGILLMTLISILLSKTGFKLILASIRQLIPFFVIIFLMNTCFFSPEDSFFSFYFINPSVSGMIQGMNVVCRVAFTMAFYNVLVSTTPPLKITEALEQILSPLGYLRVPVKNISMIISVAIQFIPTLFEETEMIRKAQIARGARFESHNIFKRAGAVMPLIIPIFITSFKRADELAMAMESRGYRLDKVGMRKGHLHIKCEDIATIFMMIGLCVIQCVIC
ncbi:MAG: energy-coupling factor transporter transmembrane protein EcfT [Velocimicrobium sp.]